MPAPKKLARDRASAQFQTRVKTSDKRRWMKAARKAGYRSVSAWVIDVLNSKAGFPS